MRFKLHVVIVERKS